MKILEFSLEKEKIELKKEYNQSHCSHCLFSPGIEYYSKKGLKCPGFFGTEEDLAKNKTIVYPLPKKFEECPYFLSKNK